MKYVVCQMHVRDFEKWKSVMEGEAEAQHKTGLTLIHLWRSIDTPNCAFFVMEAEDVDRARAYLTPLSITWAKKRAGVSRYEMHITERIELPDFKHPSVA